MLAIHIQTHLTIHIHFAITVRRLPPSRQRPLFQNTKISQSSHYSWDVLKASSSSKRPLALFGLTDWNFLKFLGGLTSGKQPLWFDILGGRLFEDRPQGVKTLICTQIDIWPKAETESHRYLTFTNNSWFMSCEFRKLVARVILNKSEQLFLGFLRFLKCSSKKVTEQLVIT